MNLVKIAPQKACVHPFSYTYRGLFVLFFYTPCGERACSLGRGVGVEKLIQPRQRRKKMSWLMKGEQVY